MSPNDAKPEPISEKPKTIPDVFRWLGNHRDGFLVSGAVLYGLGYLVWSFNAWKNRLGQLPALEFQYLIAGIVPALIILVALAGITLYHRLRKSLLSLYKRHRYLYWLIVGLPLLILMMVQLLPIAIERKWVALAISPGEIALYTVPVFLLLAYLQAVAQGATYEGDSEPAFLAIKLQRYFLAAMFFYYGMVMFLKLYPNLPQELGGPRPRYACLDLDSRAISMATQKVIAPSDTPWPTTGIDQDKVIRSKKLQVFFSSSDYLLVRVGDEQSRVGAPNQRAPLYELRKEVIRAVIWCDEGTSDSGSTAANPSVAADRYACR